MNKKEKLTKKMELLKLMLDKSNKEQLIIDKNNYNEIIDTRLENKHISGLRKK